jgi:hypothetical protein
MDDGTGNAGRRLRGVECIPVATAIFPVGVIGLLPEFPGDYRFVTTMYDAPQTYNAFTIEDIGMDNVKA